MSFVFGFFVFGLGTVAGSFLNVVILRYNSGRTLAGRSSCGSCGKALRWHELVPVVSFFVQRGTCRSCKSKISWQYPVVELLTGILFLGVFAKFAHLSFPNFLPHIFFYGTVLSLLVVIAVYDARHKIIPDGIVYAFGLLALGVVVWNDLQPDLVFQNWSGLLAGPVLALPFALLWLVSSGRWMGLGDAKLSLGIGWLLGLRAGFSAVILGVWLGALASMAIMLAQYLMRRSLKGGRERLTMKSELPLAPFLIAGFLLVFFFGIDVIRLIGYVVYG